MQEGSESNHQTKIREIVDSERFNNIVFIAILASSISIGFETYDWGEGGNKFLVYLDWFFMTIFVTEILFRIYAMRFDFFKDPWCIFDFIIVSILSDVLVLIPVTLFVSIIFTFISLQKSNQIAILKSSGLSFRPRGLQAKTLSGKELGPWIWSLERLR